MGGIREISESMELPLVEKELTQEKINRYAEVSGDLNPLHIDSRFAENTPFGGTIAHGMLVLSSLSELMEQAFGRRWVTSGRIKARFRGAARPDDHLTTSGMVGKVDDGRVMCHLECRNQEGTLLVSAEAMVTL